jgi:hypothetical protein
MRSRHQRGLHAQFKTSFGKARQRQQLDAVA